MEAEPQGGAAAIDLRHLERQTGGEAALIREVLRIFADAIIPDGRRLIASSDGPVRRDLAHKIKGAALGIGAFPLADEAGKLARASDDTADTVAFASALDVVQAEIVRLLHSA